MGAAKLPEEREADAAAAVQADQARDGEDHGEDDGSPPDGEA